MAETIGAVIIIMGALFCFVIVTLLVKTYKETRN